MRGHVTSDKMQKTLVVEVRRKVRHPFYEKYVARRTKLYVHDENSEARIGDFVEVAQTRQQALDTSVVGQRALSRLAEAQQDDGGWPVDFVSYSAAATLEWLGHRTVEALSLLWANARL